MYEVDASRQSNRISANVSGFLGTERITLNDNLLNRCSPECVQAVMGHEVGHYVMNHVYKSVAFQVILWLCSGRAIAERIPEAFPGPRGGVYFLRSPERFPWR